MSVIDRSLPPSSGPIGYYLFEFIVNDFEWLVMDVYWMLIGFN